MSLFSRSAFLRTTSSCLLLLGLLHASSLLAQPAKPSCELPQRLRFSMVPEGSIERDLQAYKPLLQDLETTLGIPVEAVKPASYSAVVEGLLSGSIHIARLGPATYVRARGASKEIEPFASFWAPAGLWQEEGSHYRSLLIVRARGAHNSLPALRGASLALADPHSTSAAVVPRTLFARHVRMPLNEYFGWTGFAGSHDAAIRSVLDGKADAAFVASPQLTGLQKRMGFDPASVKVLWQSPPLPMDPFVYRSSLCSKLRARIDEVFLRFHTRHPAGTLASLQTTRFIRVADSDFDVIRELESQ